MNSLVESPGSGTDAPGFVAQAFQPAGSGDFPVASFEHRAGKPGEPADRNVCATDVILISSRAEPLYSPRVTVLEGIQKSAEFLARKGVESPRLQAELLLADILKLPRMKLYLNFDRALEPAQIEQLREWVQRRGRREPLQHILGSVSFCGLELAVNRHVLVPRPETELLAERGWNLLNQLPTSESHPVTALDFGTGSGCIAIALAAKCPAARLHALDISAEALAIARQNAERNAVADRIQFVHGDGFGALPKEIRFDLVISNPPYIPTAEIETLEPEVRDYDPRRALDGGPDGLDCFRRLAAEARPFLKSDGRILFEFGDGQAEAIKKIFETQNWIVEAIEEDYTQRPRILRARI
jgi:release factor glutamine methyltransferase